MTTTEVRPQVEPNYVEYMPEREPEKKSQLFLFLLLGVLALMILGAFTLLQRRTQYRALANETEKLAIPTVSVVHPTPEPGQEDLVLPSTTQAYVESPIYARTNGYLKKWYHDIGSRVQKGELLADIDTPEVDQQLSQARADLNTSKANEDLSKITAVRYQELIKTDGVSKQEVDNAVGDYAAKKATTAVERGQCSAARRTRIVQAYLRALQRRHHPAQHRHRKPDQRRKWRRCAATLFPRADRSDSRLRQRAGSLRGGDSRRPGRLSGAGAIPRR